MDIAVVGGWRRQEVRVQLGEKVSEGTIVVILETAAAATAPSVVAPVCRRSACRRSARGPPRRCEIEVVVPDIGDYQRRAGDRRLRQVGDTVKVDDALVTLEVGQGDDGRTIDGLA